ncbi:cytochrome ubiquinol oxidase subunit I [Enterococcus sp. HY326]|uniref:cytochrome ubiquinol oxidase subunit I n=1 Tax=Enterococcus sp. HY326 TaxID=2971265 RepID=UPI003A101DEC
MGRVMIGSMMFVTTMSRIQFAMTAIMHFFFVPTTIGLMAATLIFELIYVFGKKENEHYGRLALFFAKLYFFSFGTGVVTGLIMEFQFGMNWSAYAYFFGDVIGVPLALEGIMAFFMESTLIGLWRFTWGKINKKLHVLFAALLLFTSLFSVVWIIMINAFMQNPVGFTMEGGRARLDSVLSLVQNPQYWPEALHVLGAIMILGGLVVCGVSAWQILKNRDRKIFKKSIQIGVLMFLPFAIIQQQMGDNQITASGALQAMKFAAVEGRYENEGSDTTGAPWDIAAWINESEHTSTGIGIPGLGSYFGNGTFVGGAEGMNEIAKTYHEKYDSEVAASYDGEMSYYPPVTLLFWCMRWMFYSGYYYVVLGTVGLLLLYRKKKSIEEHPRLLKAFGISMWFPYVTVVTGWVVAEVGRYPFVVYGIFTQLDAVSPDMTPAKIITSVTLLAIMDLLLIGTVLTIAHRTLKKGAPNIHGNYDPPASLENNFFEGVSKS